MRSDMYKLLVERPRGGRSFARHDRRDDKLVRGHDDDSHLGRTGPMRRQRDKHLNENLAPLRRFLAKQVGRPWDKVYSEIRAHIAFDNTVQRHILVHLEHYVAVSAVVKDGAVYDTRAHWYRFPLGVGELYVCPRTGLVKRVVARKAHLPHRQPDRIVLDARSQLHRIAGVWYRIYLADIPLVPPEHALLDAHFHVDVRRARHVRDRMRALYGRYDVYAQSKSQLSKHDLRAHPFV